VAVVDEDTLACGDVPLPDGGVGGAGEDDAGFVESFHDVHGVDVGRVAHQAAEVLHAALLVQGPHDSRGVVRSSDQHGA